MKIVYTIEEVKNIVASFTHKNVGGDKPTEVKFVHRYPDGSGESDVENITEISRVEVVLPDKTL